MKAERQPERAGILLLGAGGIGGDQLVAPGQHGVDHDAEAAVEPEAHELPAPLDRLQPPPGEQSREGLTHHDAQDGRIPGAGGRDGLSGQRSAQHILDMDQIGQLGHGRLVA